MTKIIEILTRLFPTPESRPIPIPVRSEPRRDIRR